MPVYGDPALFNLAQVPFRVLSFRAISGQPPSSTAALSVPACRARPQIASLRLLALRSWLVIFHLFTLPSVVPVNVVARLAPGF
jgi:hypothetical protein